MRFFTLKRRPAPAISDSVQGPSLKRRCSASGREPGLKRLRRTASRIFRRPPVSPDVSSEPEPTPVTPTKSAMTRLRGFWSSGETPGAPRARRQCSVRFVDGAGDVILSTPNGSRDSGAETQDEEPVTNATGTLVRRPMSTSPVDSIWSASPSLFSTPATSLSSPSSRLKQTTPEDCPKDSKTSIEETALAPIEEDAGRFILIPVQEAPVDTVEPSVVTVEQAAAAKVYLETQYSQLFEASPRTTRRKRMERALADRGLSHHQRERMRHQWVLAEREHLRQLRVLKATSVLRHNSKGISIAGFDVLRVLGKGSFGVVKLVTEHDTRAALNGQTPHANGGAQEGRSASTTCVGTLDGTAARKSLPAGKPLSDVFAMKVIRKSEMLRACQEGHLRAERDFLVSAEGSRWVVPLIASLQDNTNLYLVMEYMIGGDFLGLLLREDVLDEEVAKWYVAEMILCIEEAHKMKWIHRDVKPDNFLISADGHLKISDFGLAFDGHWSHCQTYHANQRYTLLDKLGIKIDGDEQDVAEELAERAAEAREDSRLVPRPRPRLVDPEECAKREGLLNYRNRTERRKLARSVVGTSQYMAPEVIQGQPYDGRCDWWSIGIILYECLYGRTPFYCESRAATKEAICRHRANLHFPQQERWSRPCSENRRLLPPPSDLAIDLMQGIITDKEVRLSSRQYRHAEAREIKSHAFFRGIPWSQVHLMQPPFVPRVKEHQSITKYFEDEKDIGTDESSGYLSTVERLGEDVDEATARAALGPTYFARWRRQKLDGEKAELGFEDCTDDELQKLKEHLGRGWAKWKAERMAEVHVQRGGEMGDRPPRGRREKKRPRDKLLRDEGVGRKVLEVRKKGAFFGYTYRRPRTVEAVAMPW
ncbi:Serine/threonine-protein kinase cbk1 [Teratosphaeria destructans]|uniref:non-specific serine/threonine protein kinase n=1 Tax=Teratosphaeria destructans TaxID=418781 RepID=A0A9W7SSK1_9PEZI|nr:Serine/threonine-protein kinase cbk1 [Teratosphaeria destructans]